MDPYRAVRDVLCWLTGSAVFPLLLSALPIPVDRQPESERETAVQWCSEAAPDPASASLAFRSLETGRNYLDNLCISMLVFTRQLTKTVSHKVSWGKEQYLKHSNAVKF